VDLSAIIFRVAMRTWLDTGRASHFVFALLKMRYALQNFRPDRETYHTNAVANRTEFLELRSFYRGFCDKIDIMEWERHRSNIIIDTWYESLRAHSAVSERLMCQTRSRVSKILIQSIIRN
jgi:hypothetical protein